MPQIVAMAGSSRKESVNRAILKAAVAGAGDSCEVRVVDLRDFELPLYDGDHESEHGVPENAKKLVDIFASADGILLGTPEYNSSITPLLKNTLDWMTRVESGSDKAFKGKVAALVAASPGGLGGIRVLRHVREILTTLNVIVLPRQQAVSRAFGLIEDGEMKAGDQRDAVMAVGRELADYLNKP